MHSADIAVFLRLQCSRFIVHLFFQSELKTVTSLELAIVGNKDTSEFFSTPLAATAHRYNMKLWLNHVSGI